MVFSSLTFLIFFALVCAVMALTKLAVLRDKPYIRTLRQVILLAASYVFYGWWSWKCCFLMLGLTLAAYAFSLAYEKTERKLFVVLGVILPLVILGIFKYFNFFVDSFCSVFSIRRSGSLRILLPVGISFYTFQSMSYTLDVYRGRIPAEHSFVRVALYVAFFPQLVAGPIVKAGEFLPQLDEDRNISLDNFALGIQYFVFGLFKKLVIADNISVFVDAVYRNPAEFHAFSVLLAVFAYSMQIYCDFSGYSDMAVGCARCLGYELTVNFDLPYLSKNVSEFWKRWHISLSSWLQQYLYIPLGGNRRGAVRTYVNLFLTMLIGGLWHGAAWTFVIWGGLHGLALCVHKLYRKLRGKEKNGAVGTILSVVGTFVFVSLCWVFFRADSFDTATRVFRAIFTWQNGLLFISSWAVFGIAVVTIAELCALLRCRRNGTALKSYYPTVDLGSFRGLLIFFLAVGLTLMLAYTGESPFIYFQF